MDDDIHNSFESEDYYSSDDEDYFAIVGFDEEEARKQLLSFPECTKITLDRDLQQDMGVEVGPNVSAEKPWKQIRKEILEDYLPDDTPALMDLKIKLREMESGQLVLFGYAPQFSDHGDVFVVFENERVSKEASEIVRKLEILDRLKARNLIIKQPRKWEGAGSEREVDLFQPESRETSSYVEVQSTYPIRKANSIFTMRLCEDLRDGYVELVPGRIKIETVYKKTNDMPIQCGSIPCHKYQQTDPTFPTNAWSQYLYEIKKEQDLKPIEESSTSSSKDTRSQMTTPGTELPIQASEKVKNLIGTLEFNKIDMYRDDYNLIARKPIPRYQTPYLEEAFCFADMSKTKDRFVSSITWHPQFSGVVAVSYTFETFSTFIPNDQNPNIVKRTILEKNPVLIWSFDDTLKPKLELVAPREVYCLSFCPYNPDILIGGMISGDIVLWDLKGCIERVEVEEVLTPEQSSNRRMTREFLNWMKVTETTLVHPAAISNMEESHLEPVSSVKWLPQNFYVTNSGQVKESPHKDKKTFVTSSLDGFICFWDMDWVVPDDELKKRKVERKFRVPVNLEVENSPYVKLDMSWKPVYRLVVEKPLTGILLTDGTYRYEAINSRNKGDITQRIIHKIIPEYAEHFDMSIICCTVFGQICTGHWEGFDFSQGAAVNEEKLPVETFPPIHNDPIIALERNPFIPNVFMTIGGTIFSIWKQNFKEAPIFWRTRPNRITSGKWSNDRPACLFLTLSDGSFEAWDLIARTNEPCLVESLGGNILTAMSQHKLTLPRSVLAIGDYNSSLRIFIIPNAFVQIKQDEVQEVQKMFDRIVKIKQDQEAWKRLWADQNRDLIHSRLVAAYQMKAETKRLMEEEEQAARMRPSTISTQKPKQDHRRIDFAEQAEKKWNEQNYERLLKVLMERRRVNPEVLEKLTRPEKDRRQYQAEKKQAIEASFSRINEELAELRSRLIPKEVIDDSRDRLVEGVAETAVSQMKEYSHVRIDAIEMVIKLICNLHVTSIFNFFQIEKNAEMTHEFSATEILERARQRREIIDRALGGNPAKMEQYLKEKQRRHADRMHHLGADMSQTDRSNTLSLMSDFKMDETVVSSMSIR
uniref:CSON008647 protein n=1 Tax=Culicoides sonorensis TaxID=179676 RepID=A0A336M1S0_CULSO